MEQESKASVILKSTKVEVCMKSEQGIVLNFPIIGYSESYPVNVGNVGSITNSYINILVPATVGENIGNIITNNILEDSIYEILNKNYGNDGVLKFYKDTFINITLTRYETYSDGSTKDTVLESIIGQYSLDRIYKSLENNEHTGYRPGMVTHICLYNKFEKIYNDPRY